MQMNAGEGRSIGISDMKLYIPRPAIDIETIIERRTAMNPGLIRHLDRASRTTGQQTIRFPEMWEDSATMAAKAAFDLFRENPDADPKSLRHLAVGTETGVDHSKPLSAYVQGMLAKAGLAVPGSLSSFQVQHACAGGTMALLGVAAMLKAGAGGRDSGLVVNTDVARYETESTAEITQGAGAVALYVEAEPRLLELDLASVGYFSADVDDFFRPLGSTTARVNGSYSMRCYTESLEAALLDHCARTGERPERALLDADLLVLHTPFRNMPVSAMEKLLAHVMGFDQERARRYLAERSFAAALDPMARIGNLYTGSLWAGLAFALADRFRAVGASMIGKRVLLASYGSGSTMVVISGRVAEGAADVVSRWRLEEHFTSARPASFQEYEAWISGPVQPELQSRMMEHAVIPPDAFVLSGIRRDGYREYEYKKSASAADRGEERESPDDLHRSVAIPG
jgi:hydroxymethylglutaryl-CoA synthase